MAQKGIGCRVNMCQTATDPSSDVVSGTISTSGTMLFLGRHMDGDTGRCCLFPKWTRRSVCNSSTQKDSLIEWDRLVRLISVPVKSWLREMTSSGRENKDTERQTVKQSTLRKWEESCFRQMVLVREVVSWGDGLFKMPTHENELNYIAELCPEQMYTSFLKKWSNQV